MNEQVVKGRSAWPGAEVKMLLTSDLVPYARNAKQHPEAQVVQIAASIKEWGFTIPVLVDENRMIIAGHGRLLAAIKLGLSEVPCVVASGWSDEKKRAYVIADNKLTENGGWDNELLGLELSDLIETGFEMNLTGFSETEIGGILDELAAMGAVLEGEDEVPDTSEASVSVLGDLWLLGDHRILCGDGTKPADVRRVLGSVKPLLMVTDPPYGVGYDPAWRSEAGLGRTERTGKVLNDDRADWRDAWELFPGEVAYVWHGALHSSAVADSLESSGFAIRSQIIWAKDRLVLSRGDYHWQHEPCWYAVRRSGKGNWAGDRKQTTLWHVANKDQDAQTVHGTQKPVECMRRAILNNSNPGQLIYDPFLGSGTTMIAAETTGRACLGIELDPAYVDVTVRRWEQFTGGTAKLEGTDQGFEEIARLRADVDGDQLFADGQNAEIATDCEAAHDTRS